MAFRARRLVSGRHVLALREMAFARSPILSTELEENAKQNNILKVEQSDVVSIPMKQEKVNVTKLGRNFATSTLASAWINVYNCESSDGKKEAVADGETGSGKSYKAAPEENDTEVNVNDVAPSRIKDIVNKMLRSLKKQVDDVDSKIRNYCRDLTRYYDGRFSREKVAEDAAVDLEINLDNGKIQGLVKDLSKDKVYELRLSCCYSYKEGKLQLNNLTVHGVWPAHLVNGEVVHIINEEEEIARNMPIAVELLKQLGVDYPDIISKMETHWISIDHTTNLKAI
ncbi:hypothetical protein AgCh_035854 [Apium graveolens]